MVGGADGHQDRDGVAAPNQYEVDAALVGRKVELVFDPFDLTRIEVRYQHRPLVPRSRW